MANVPSETRIDRAIEKVIAQLPVRDRDMAASCLYQSWRTGGSLANVGTVSASWTLGATWVAHVKLLSGEEYSASVEP